MKFRRNIEVIGMIEKYEFFKSRDILLVHCCYVPRQEKEYDFNYIAKKAGSFIEIFILKILMRKTMMMMVMMMLMMVNCFCGMVDRLKALRFTG